MFLSLVFNQIMQLLKNSQIRLETLNHALITNPNGKEFRISHWAVDVQNIHEILVVCHEEDGLGMDEVTLSWDSIKDWSIQLQTEGYRIH
tara:strand:+ start:1696 stop:1965 length:270 start_codon:yes stop_codon:yes gene_type:complete